MHTDLVLAIVHHVLVFGLVGLIVGEGVLLRGEVSAATVLRIARLDAAVGASAGLVLVVGFLRVVFGLRGWDYYAGNEWFWAKLATFVAVALVSIVPTLLFLRWRKDARADPAFVPPANEVARALTAIRIESLLVVLILAFAATMARFN